MLKGPSKSKRSPWLIQIPCLRATLQTIPCPRATWKAIPLLPCHKNPSMGHCRSQRIPRLPQMEPRAASSASALSFGTENYPK